MAWLTKISFFNKKSLQVRICRITIYYIKEILPIISYSSEYPVRVQ